MPREGHTLSKENLLEKLVSLNGVESGWGESFQELVATGGQALPP